MIVGATAAVVHADVADAIGSGDVVDPIDTNN